MDEDQLKELFPDSYNIKPIELNLTVTNKPNQAEYDNISENAF